MTEWMRRAQAEANVKAKERNEVETKKLRARAEYLASFLGRDTWEDIHFAPYSNTTGSGYAAQVDGYWWYLEKDSADEWYKNKNRGPVKRVNHVKLSKTKETYSWHYVHDLAEVGEYIKENPPEGGLPNPDAEPEQSPAFQVMTVGTDVVGPEDPVEPEEEDKPWFRRRSSRWRD